MPEGMLSSSDPMGVKAKWVGRVGDFLQGASITTKWEKYGVVLRRQAYASYKENLG